MTSHPWVAAADSGVRFGVQVSAEDQNGTSQRLVEIGRYAEDLGFDGFFVADHPLRMPDPWTILSAVAAQTSEIWLGSVVNCAFYRHPLTFARLITDLDRLSGGRLMFGIGIGWDWPEFDALGIPRLRTPALQDALDEALQIIEGAWGEDPFTLRGAHFTSVGAQIPPPLQQPRPPLMIAGGGEKRTLLQVAQFADACNIDELERSGINYVRHKFDVLRRHCEAVGRPYDEILRTHYTNHLIIASTEAEVQEIYEYRLSPESRAEREARWAEAFPNADPGIEDRVPLKGTPEQLIEHYQRRVEAGVQYFIIYIPLHLESDDRTMLDLFANQVMPALR